MGKLRVVPKDEAELSNERYEAIKSILNQAKEASAGNLVYWDMDDSEDSVKTKKEFVLVASKEGIQVAIRRLRKKRSLQLDFSVGSARVKRRLTAQESRNRILEALRTAGRPMVKSELIEAAEIKKSTWNVRIGELIEEGSIKRRHSEDAAKGNVGASYELTGRR